MGELNKKNKINFSLIVKIEKKISNLLKKASFLSKESKSKYFYPLLENAFFKEDIFSAIEVLLSKKLTMGKITDEFEKNFCRFIGSKYAVMVNSGSSANLLAMFASINPMRKNRAKYGDSSDTKFMLVNFIMANCSGRIKT